MASITFGSIVAEARGSVGSDTYARNQWGAYVKARTTPTNPNTAAQIAARLRIKNAVIAWQALTDAQRYAYNITAENYSRQNRVGQSFKLTGYNLFIRHYQLRNAFGLGSPSSAQVPQMKATSAIKLINSAANIVRVELNTPSIIADQGVLWYVTKYRSASRQAFNPSQSILMLSQYIVSAGISSIDLEPYISLAIGTTTSHVGEKITLGLCDVNVRTGEWYKRNYLSLTLT